MSAEIREYTRTQTATGILLTEGNLWEVAELATRQPNVVSAGVFREDRMGLGETVRGLTVLTEGGEQRIHVGQVVSFRYASAGLAMPVTGEWQEAEVNEPLAEAVERAVQRFARAPRI